MNRPILKDSESSLLFTCGKDRFGINATAIRSVLPAPAVTPTPHSDPVLKGIAHIQNEFLAVVSLQALIQSHYETSDSAEQQLLILLGSAGPWGLLIDEALTLAALETSSSAFPTHHDHWSKISPGTATVENHVVKILDPEAMFQYAADLVNSYWDDAGGTDFNDILRETEASN